MFATLPFLLISICSPLFYYLCSLLSHSPPSSLPPPCRAVVSLQLPQSSPHRKSWRRSKPVSLESRLGDFQPLVSGLLSGPVGAWELAAQGDYCWRQINHTWQAIVQKAPKRARTHAHIHLDTNPAKYSPPCRTSLLYINGDVKWYRADFDIAADSLAQGERVCVCAQQWQTSACTCTRD